MTPTRASNEHVSPYRMFFESHPDPVAVFNESLQLISCNEKYRKLTAEMKEWIEVRTKELLGPLTADDASESSSSESRIVPWERTFYGQQEQGALTYFPMIHDHTQQGFFCIVQKAMPAPVNHDSELAFLHNMKQLILDSVTEGIYGIDLDANVIFWNKAAERITGYRHDEIHNQNLHELIHHTNKEGLHVPLVNCPVYHFLTHGQAMVVADDVFWHKNGTSIPVEYTVNPIMDGERSVGAVITFRDKTNKLLSEQMLLHTEKLSAIGQLAAGIAHELRNPLTSLKGFLKLLQANPKKYYYEIMDAEFDRIESILHELLLFSKPQASNYTVIDVQEVIQQIVLILETQAILKNITIKTHMEPHPVTLLCIEHQIKQVFINVLKNAIESMTSSGIIDIHVRSDKESVYVSVADQGCGMSPERLSRIGQPFYSTKEKGTGLGLMVTYNIVQNHHKGSIQVESKEGEGTTFHFGFPRGC